MSQRRAYRVYRVYTVRFTCSLTGPEVVYAADASAATPARAAALVCEQERIICPAASHHVLSVQDAIPTTCQKQTNEEESNGSVLEGREPQQA